MSIESTINCPLFKRPRRFSSRIGLHFGPDGSRSKMINETIDSLMKGDKQFRSKSSALQENFIYQKSLKIYAYLSIRMRHNPVFLNRNLAYNKRKIKKKTWKKNIDLDNLLYGMVKEDEHQKLKDHSLQLDSLQINLMDDLKKSEIVFSITGFYSDSSSFSQSILRSNDFNNSIRLYAKRIVDAKEMISLDATVTIPKSVTSLFFYFNIDNKTKEYYLNFGLKEFLNSINGSWSFSVLLHDSSSDLKSFKVSSVNELINSFRLNQNLIKFKLICEDKATRIKTKIRNNLVQVSSTKSSPNNQQQTQKSCTNFNSVLYQICKPDASMAIQGFSQNYRCPFCYICLDNFVNLINHLKGIHSRFICRDFLTNNQQIDIIPDDLFDGSFSGDLIDYKRNEYLGYCKCRGKPTKRAPGLLFCVFNNFYGKMLRKNGDIDVALSWHSQSLAPNNSPQNRIYYHSLTNLAKKFNSDEDSEVEQDWLEVIKQRNFDKLEDVNQGQKDIMNLWNKHCLKHNLIARSNVFDICQLFIKENLSTLINLEKNCLLHFVNLLDYKLLKKKELFKLIELISELNRDIG